MYNLNKSIRRSTTTRRLKSDIDAVFVGDDNEIDDDDDDKDDGDYDDTTTHRRIRFRTKSLCRIVLIEYSLVVISSTSRCRY